MHIRSFISTKTTGAGLFRGDGRGPSLKAYPDAWSRVRSSFTVDPTNSQISEVTAISDPTVFYGDHNSSILPSVAVGSPTASIENRNFSEGSASFNFHHSGKDPITPGILTPSLDVHSSLTITEDLENGVLNISGSFSGDRFPSTEAFVVDQSGETKVFLGAKMESGGLHSLFGNNKKPLFTVDMEIIFDEKGNFTGVRQGDKTYSIEEWNKQVQDEFKD